MSNKRHSSFQGRREEEFEASHHEEAVDPVVRATAAQMATRKIKTAKSRMTPGGSRPAFGGFSGSSSVPAPSANPFASFGGTATSSFPPAEAPEPNNAFTNSSFPAFGSNNNASSGFSFTPQPPSTGFTFGAQSTNNPFANLNSTSTQQPEVSKSLSLFAPQQTASQPEVSNSPSLFAPQQTASQPEVTKSPSLFAPQQTISQPASSEQVPASSSIFSFPQQSTVSEPVSIEQAPATSSSWSFNPQPTVSQPSFSEPAPVSSSLFNSNIQSTAPTSIFQQAPTTSSTPSLPLSNASESIFNKTPATNSPWSFNPKATISQPSFSESAPASSLLFSSNIQPTASASIFQQAPTTSSTLSFPLSTASQSVFQQAPTTSSTLSFPLSTASEPVSTEQTPTTSSSFFPLSHQQAVSEPTFQPATPTSSLFIPSQQPTVSQPIEQAAGKSSLFSTPQKPTVSEQKLPAKSTPFAWNAPTLNPNFPNPPAASSSSVGQQPQASSSPFSWKAPALTAPFLQQTAASSSIADKQPASSGFSLSQETSVSKPTTEKATEVTEAKPNQIPQAQETAPSIEPPAPSIPSIPRALAPQNYSRPTIEGIPLPAELDPLGKKLVALAAELSLLNQRLKDKLNSVSTMMDWSALTRWHVKLSNEIMKKIVETKKERAKLNGVTGTESTSTKRKATEDESPSKKAKPSQTSSLFGNALGQSPQSKTPLGTTTSSGNTNAVAKSSLTEPADGVASPSKNGPVSQTSTIFGSSFGSAFNKAPSGTTSGATNSIFTKPTNEAATPSKHESVSESTNIFSSSSSKTPSITITGSNAFSFGQMSQSKAASSGATSGLNVTNSNQSVFDKPSPTPSAGGIFAHLSSGTSSNQDDSDEDENTEKGSAKPSLLSRMTRDPPSESETPRKFPFFDFGKAGSATPSAAPSAPPSVPPSVFSSRATTPFSDPNTSDNNTENEEDEASKGEQLDLSNLTEEEKAQNEVLFYTEKAIAQRQVDKGSGKTWEKFARGPLWILKNKETDKALVRMRLPSGTTPVNYNILPKIKASVSGASGKMVLAAQPGDAGKPTSLFFSLKSADVAEEFSTVYNNNHPSA